MRLSDSSHTVFANYFSETGCCEFDEFPAVRLRSGFVAKMVLRLTLADGITFGSVVLVDPKYIKRRQNGKLYIPKSLLAHELVHVLQYKEMGFIRFLIRYLQEFWTEFRQKKQWSAKAWFEAYEAMPIETEARERASDFMVWYEQNKT